MLQQILQDMRIDPELLCELDDEQKQVLFCRMREEQVRRWKEHEAKLEEEEKRKTRKSSQKKKKETTKKIDFLLGKDGKPWTWVMGDHGNDRTIEEIMDEEAHTKAAELAEHEAAALRVKEEEEMRNWFEKEAMRVEEDAKQKQEGLRKRAEEEAQKAESAQLSEQQQQKLEQIKNRREVQRRKSIDMVESMKRRRSIEIFSTYRVQRQQREKEAEESSAQIEHNWQEQEKKAKQVEEEKRLIARHARREHQQSLREQFKAKATMINAINSFSSKSTEEKPPHRPASISSGKFRTTKPDNHQAIVQWYRELEFPKGSGIDPLTKRVCPWFHGIISRQASEDLLEVKPVGSYLIRVSERIWGYAISYRGAARCKHFLIDTNDNTYQFFGTNQIQHPSLSELINFHKKRPISSAGQEMLKYACGTQTSHPADFEELFQGLPH